MLRAQCSKKKLKEDQVGKCRIVEPRETKYEFVILSDLPIKIYRLTTDVIRNITPCVGLKFSSYSLK